MSDSGTITTIDLLRHGECEGGEIFRGKTDVALTDKGWENMQRVVDYQYKEGLWGHVISSPLVRCRRFAEHLQEIHNLSYSIEHDFREMDFGDWEGQEFWKVFAQEKERVEGLYTSPHTFQPPNGEHMSEFSDRVINSVKKVLYEHKGKHLLLIQHGGTIRVLLTHLLTMPMASMTNFDIPYASFSRIQIHHMQDKEAVSLVFHNRSLL